MGTWGTAAWDNDYAADWFGELVLDTGIIEKVEKTLKSSFAEADHEEIRAAAAALILLGHPFIWDFEVLEDHLELAVTRLKEILVFFQGQEKMEQVIQAEIEVLSLRLERLRAPQKTALPEQVKWWHF